jgi:hypothetical protein
MKPRCFKGVIEVCTGEELRDANTIELDEARTIAKSMIDAYFEYLESNSGNDI